MIHVIDDIVPLSYQEEIKDTLFNDNFPWFFREDVTTIKGSYDNNAPAFGHQFVVDGAINSRFWSTISCVPHLACKEVGVPFKGVIRARTFLQLSLNLNNLNNKVDPLHVDCAFPHYALIYYVVDSDGDTLITSKKYDSAKGTEEGLYAQEHEIINRVTPKRGRIVLFDGAYYHTAEQPISSSVRCIINFNLTK